MAANQIGTDLIVAVGTTISGYVVESITTGNKDVSMSDVKDEDGVLKTRIVKQTMAKVSLSLYAVSGTVPSTDWPTGGMATVTGWTAYFVDNCSIARTEDAMKVTVELTNIGIT